MDTFYDFDSADDADGLFSDDDDGGVDVIGLLETTRQAGLSSDGSWDPANAFSNVFLDFEVPIQTREIAPGIQTQALTTDTNPVKCDDFGDEFMPLLDEREIPRPIAESSPEKVPRQMPAEDRRAIDITYERLHQQTNGLTSAALLDRLKATKLFPYIVSMTQYDVALSRHSSNPILTLRNFQDIVTTWTNSNEPLTMVVPDQSQRTSKQTQAFVARMQSDLATRLTKEHAREAQRLHALQLKETPKPRNPETPGIISQGSVRILKKNGWIAATADACIERMLLAKAEQRELNELERETRLALDTKTGQRLFRPQVNPSKYGSDGSFNLAIDATVQTSVQMTAASKQRCEDRFDKDFTAQIASEEVRVHELRVQLEDSATAECTFSPEIHSKFPQRNDSRDIGHRLYDLAIEQRQKRAQQLDQRQSPLDSPVHTPPHDDDQLRLSATDRLELFYAITAEVSISDSSSTFQPLGLIRMNVTVISLSDSDAKWRSTYLIMMVHSPKPAPVAAFDKAVEGMRLAQLEKARKLQTIRASIAPHLNVDTMRTADGRRTIPRPFGFYHKSSARAYAVHAKKKSKRLRTLKPDQIGDHHSAVVNVHIAPSLDHSIALSQVQDAQALDNVVLAMTSVYALDSLQVAGLDSALHDFAGLDFSHVH
ncbi:hypothetical protein DYB37_006895 [Aphanomyces astaci]|uniref:Uncharacterized protein n=1 Tax=Aphanomyces astaci TaxID=112090 RepID=A0A3R7AAS9_APHAT|nr:hypothetical protein DYB35_006423 [Aphanomyces astaci]RHZ11323.1 hypothetical protein DYB37_006895 [Aphanomyces astaci]